MTRAYVSVSIDLDEIGEEDMVEYLKKCGYAVIKGDGPKGFDIDDLDRVYEAMRDGRTADAFALMERLVRPKWPTPEACIEALSRARKESHPRK